ncbi:hypothetical protein [Chondromyces apiculatus]|nr:hypothetical protein [Chondromyces apiculatus]
MSERTAAIRRRRGGACVAAVLAALSVRCGGAQPAAGIEVTAKESASAGVRADATSSAGAGAKGSAGGGAKGVKLGVGGFVTPARLLPDLVGENGVIAYEDGHRRLLVARMRLLAHEDGSIERAAELLPHGRVMSLPLPSRFGGGYLFHGSNRGGTQIWRAEGWLGKLTPVVQLPSEVAEVIAGFDRLYLRLSSNMRLVAIDAQSGAALPLGPLPLSGGYGQIVFADGWRGLVESDLRGVLATFDAGTTWQPVRVERKVSDLRLVGGDPAMMTSDGFYAVDARGNVTFRPPLAGEEDEALAVRPPGLLGRRPLRAAVEDGWPEADGTAVVARGGAIARVSLADGAVKALVPEAYPERQASCHAVRVGGAGSRGEGARGEGARAEASPGPGFGFVCGERDGATAIYAFEAPLGMRALHRFKRPRFVAPSGNGSLVVRGPCGEEEATAGVRTYCVLAPEGNGLRSREIRVKAARQDLGVERVVALADGRVAVLVPPRDGASGQLTLLEGNEATTRALVLPARPRGAGRDLRRGMWLEGFEEREPGVLGGWVEAGGPILGVRIDVKDGRVKAGEARHDPTGAILSGRFAISLGEGDVAAESMDGGMTWQTIEVPEPDEEHGASPTRACGPVGCVIKGWMRVGWGSAEGSDDLAVAETPAMLHTALRTSPTLSLSCGAVGSSTPPLPPLPEKSASSGRVQGPVMVGSPHSPRRPEMSVSGWNPFRNTPPPTLGADEIGFDNGAPHDLVTLRAYVWGKKGADWARGGRFQVRFDDRFDPGGGVRSSAVSPSPWPDETAAAEGIGGYSYGAANWGAFLDPGGRAAMGLLCRGAGCELYGIVEGQPVLPLRDGSGRIGAFPRPVPYGVVRAGEAWFFLTPAAESDKLALWRADLGAARILRQYERLDRAVRMHVSYEMPRLVRRASGAGVGLLVSMPPEPEVRSGSWVVLPVDAESGEVGEAIALVRKDLSNATVQACAPGQDGWVFDTALETSPSFSLAGKYVSVESPELRLRVDPGTACVESIGARLQGEFTPEGGARGAPAGVGAGARAVPFAATERPSGKRWNFQCTLREQGGGAR